MPPLPLVIPWCEQSRTLSEGSGGTGIRLYRSRWLMLAILSLLAMLSDWICFSVAPIPGLTMLAYSGVHPASLVTLFLSTNVFFCLFEPLIVKRHGLRETVVYGAALMAIGCVLRSGLPGFPTTSASVVMLGTVFVGAAQPFFQCTPALLAATWFGPDERTLATTIAINANQIGIALSYICGAYLVHDVGDFYGYFLLLAVFACSLFAFTLCFFRDAPPTPPSIASGGRASSSTALDQMGAGGSKEASASLGDALDKLGGGGGGGGGGGSIGVLKRCALLLLGAVGGGRGGGYRTTNNTWRDAADVAVQIRKLINTDGFVIASSAFVVSIGITNVISTFLDHMLEHLGFHQHTIGIIGAAFQVAIMVGSLLFGSYVDRTKKYVTATVFCFIASFFFLSGASEKELHGNGLVVCILCVGFFVGPIQPITAEIAVEVRPWLRACVGWWDDGMVGWWFALPLLVYSCFRFLL
jgi:MFS family permease